MTEINEHLAFHVEARRRSLSMSIGELERETRLSQPVVTDVRKGRVKSYNETTIFAFAAALHWTVDWYERLLAGETPDATWDSRDALRRAAGTEIDTARQAVSRDYNSDISETAAEEAADTDDLEARVEALEEWRRGAEMLLAFVEGQRVKAARGLQLPEDAVDHDAEVAEEASQRKQ